MSDNNNNDNKQEKKITLEDFYQGMIEGFTETQQILYNTGQKFQAIADAEKEKLPSSEERDEFKKDVAETIAAIEFTIHQMMVEMERLYNISLFDRERLKLSYEIIEMFLDYTVKDKEQHDELDKIIHNKVQELERRLSKLRKSQDKNL